MKQKNYTSYCTAGSSGSDQYNHDIKIHKQNPTYIKKFNIRNVKSGKSKIMYPRQCFNVV